jgi:hypothetical protein
MPSKSSNLSTRSNNVSSNSSKCQMGNIPLFISFIVAIIFYIIIIVSLSNIEKLSNCDCSKLHYKDYVKEWFVFMIFYIVVLAILFSVGNFECWELFINYPPIFGIVVIIGLVTLIMIIKLFLYLREIKNNCNCAYGSKEAFLYWFMLIYFSIIIALISLVVIIAIFATLFLFISK